MRFSRTERRDLLIAWIVLSVAFTLFLGRPAIVARPVAAARLFVICLLTAGIGFLVHELAHKGVAVYHGRPAEFRADYRLLAVTLLSGAGGLLFAAPGAVHHWGHADQRELGLVAVAGPVSNLLLLAVFSVFWAVPISAVATFGAFGVWINALLAAFNMLPFGPLDGRTVLRWHPGVYLGVAVPAGIAAVLAFATVGIIPV